MEKKPAFVITRSGSGNWMYAGRTVQELMNTLKGEAESLMDSFKTGDSVDAEQIQIHCGLFSDKQIASMGEFDGW